LDGKLLRRVQAFVTMSEADRSALVAAGLPAAKIHVIRPGAAAPDMSGSATDFRQNLDIPMDAPIIMGVGHLETADRFHDLVWAYEFMKYILPQLQLVLIGDGPNRDRLGHHFHTARDPKLGVHFLGFRSDAASLLTLADVVVVPHRRVGGTFAVLEAMGAGRPVVATRLPHLAEIIRDGETGLLVPPVDQPALARCILRLLENRPLQDEIGTNSRSWMLGECRVATMTQGFVQVYTDVLKR
jgi:glycosyltransferase involved in cell wall biosynthesis